VKGRSNCSISCRLGVINLIASTGLSAKSLNVGFSEYTMFHIALLHRVAMSLPANSFSVHLSATFSRICSSNKPAQNSLVNVTRCVCRCHREDVFF
jgi:hypothetical protein